MSKIRDLTTLVAWAAFACCSTAFCAEPPDVGKIDFESQIRPILTARCANCHGPDKPKSGLRFDLRSNLLRGGDSGEAAVVPGRPEASRLILAVTGDDPDLKMPPKGDGLSKDQVALLREWVRQGAVMPEGSSAGIDPASPDHWSLHPLRAVSPPDGGPWADNPIDAFISEGLKQVGLSPSPEADARTLIRRVSLDLLGLPPSPEEVEAFVREFESPGMSDVTYARLIDRLLARPEYGERWAQHWLDVVRWAETWGYETNLERPNSWPYRDWVIRALNDDLPYDQFLFRQVAGDTVGDDAATGFLVAGPANLPGQIGKDEESMRQARQDELDETIKTVGSTLLGLTIGCARCHNHKFDPISQRDYYSMQAIFAGLHYGHRRLRGPENDRWAAEAARIKTDLEALRERVASLRVSLKLEPPVQPDRQVESIPPTRARSIRMNIRSTNDNTPASLYELEVWAQATKVEGSRNVALESQGAKADGSSFALENQTRHPDNLIDGLGRDGGRYPWKAASSGPAWVRIDLPSPSTVDRIVWMRGFDGFPADYDIEVDSGDGRWRTVVTSRTRQPHELDRRPPLDVVIDGVSGESKEELLGFLTRARSLDAELTRLLAGPQTFGGQFQTPERTHRLQRGDAMQRKEELGPEVPAVLASLRLPPNAEDANRRVAFGQWLAQPDHPLTARVMVNRIWQHHFGTGLVDTPSDFGRMGASPTHPSLLDWLAQDFIRSGWSIKHVHRRILLSRTYRQSSAPRAEALAIDADSRRLWRFPPRRIEGEGIRDAILKVSGNLDTKMHGVGFDFFNQRGGLTDYIPKDGSDPRSWRRMVYATKVRMQTVDVFGAFDCPDAGQMTPRRSRSTTPIQALGLFNSAFVNRQAEVFAGRVVREAGGRVEDQVRQAMRLALGRSPSPSETRALVDLAAGPGLPQVARVLFNANEFVYIP